MPVPTSPLVDCHLHTVPFSCDASATLEGLIARGRELGLSALCTTEHVDFDPQDECYGHYDYERHAALRTRIRAHPPAGLAVMIGAEIDYQRRFEGEVRAFLQAADYDFVIGSVHYAGGRFALVDDFFDRPEQSSYMAYLEEVLHAAQSGLFDVLGHLDIVKRRGVLHHGPFRPERYAEAIDAILRACVDTGTGLEINTSGLRQAPQETFPALPVVRRYRELGGEVLTIGSDAHTQADVGRDIDRALDVAQAAGLRAIAVFVARRPQWLAI
jgi:histidinol-phosphatase (PHP family)